MSAAGMWALVLHEWRLRSRRGSSLVALLAVVALTWAMVLDPASGAALMVVHRQRMAYDSQALAFATTLMGALLFGLAGFYLTRGRTEEDLRCGTAAVLAATPARPLQLLGARWLGGVAYLLGLGTLAMLTVWVLQLLRGEGPLQPTPYLQMLLLGLLPGLMWCASLAVLADAWAPLIAKRGDVLYWLLWLGQMAFMPVFLSQGRLALSGWQVFDFQGSSVLVVGLSELLDVAHVTVGGGPFDAALPVLRMPAGLWTRELVALRLGSMLLAMLPLGLAAAVFHRYAPDRVRPRASARAGVLQRALNVIRQPLRRGAGRMWLGAVRLPRPWGPALAELTLVWHAQPLLAAAAVAGALAGATVPALALPGVMAATLAAWGLALADIASREWQSGTTGLLAAAPGGASARGLRLVGVAVAWGWVLLLPAAWRNDAAWGVGGFACAAGVACAGALAVLLGRLTRGSRAFLAAFLFALYLNLQRTGVPALDLFGLLGQATLGSAAAYGAAAVLVVALVHRLNRA
ncbi:hypothetical protein [Roseateles sp. BYS87W]|uniref:ABC-2 type transport system permease protein n=1 Tax=Pelomonas baiyunensis TaxID=3299026 RepID=A0ABW7GWU4_9BURK